MSGISLKAIAIALIATLALDTLCGIALTLVVGGGSFTQGMTEDETRAALSALTADRRFLIWSFVLGTSTTVFGGYLAARFSKVVPYMNALAFGVLGILVAVLTASDLPRWYSVFGFVTTVPAALLGAWIYKRQNLQSR